MSPELSSVELHSTERMYAAAVITASHRRPLHPAPVDQSWRRTVGPRDLTPGSVQGQARKSTTSSPRYVPTNYCFELVAYGQRVPRRTHPDPHALAIGQRIKHLREEAGLTMEKLAYEADFSKGHLSNLERGYVMPTVATLQLLADRL
jgi:DNA-binding XRE family transcriptional regulator